MGVLTQRLALDDDLRSEIQDWAQAELKGMGCCTWAEFEVEVRLATSSRVHSHADSVSQISLVRERIAQLS